jgi:predicted DNA-binding antitoxin AbrB/MazE fold protein
MLCYDKQKNLSTSLPGITELTVREGSMEKTIRARYKKGVIEPLEKLDLEEGAEVEITVSSLSSGERAREAIKATAGAWSGEVNCDELIKDIYEDRRLSAARPEVRL